jgi:hypothetical protein
MPHLRDKLRRLELNAGMPPQTGADLNYLITRLVDEYVACKGLRYDTLQEVAGALDCAHREFQRVVLDPYEEIQEIENGSAYGACSLLIEIARERHYKRALNGGVE